MSPEVRAVREGFVINLKDDIVNLVNILERRAVCNIICDFHNAAVVIGKTDFRFRAAHAVGGIAGELARCNGDLPDSCAERCEGCFHADADIRRTADNVHRLAAARIHLQQMQLLGIRMRFHGLDLSNHNAVNIRALHENLVLHFGSGKGKLMDQL